MIDRGTCKAMLRESARLMLEQADRLSDIDSKFGDGDHGITITKIAKLMDERAEAWDEESIKDFLDDLGMAAMAVRGGSAGPLYGTLISGLGAQFGDDENELSADAARRMFAGCLAEMQDITNAQVGDKTMMDALIPAVEAAQACEAEGDDAAAADTGGDVRGSVLFLCGYGCADQGALRTQQTGTLPRRVHGCDKAFQYCNAGPRIFRTERRAAARGHQENGERSEHAAYDYRLPDHP